MAARTDRSTVVALWSWARVDLNRPLAVIAVKDEASMKALAPRYWEQKKGVRPTSVWVTGADQHYLAIRTDQQGKDQHNVNPHVTAYFSYLSLVLQQSSNRDLPLWFSRGFSGVLSNTIVYDTYVLVGAPIPWHLDRLRERSRLPLATMLKVTRASPEFTLNEGLSRFDAQSWALVHFLMFGDKRAHRPKLDAFIELVSDGADPEVAFRETLGAPENLESALFHHIGRNLFSADRFNVDVSVQRERFTVRTLAPAESGSMRALFHAAMDRPIDARAAIDAARKAGPAPDRSSLKPCSSTATASRKRRSPRTNGPSPQDRRTRTRIIASRSCYGRVTRSATR